MALDLNSKQVRMEFDWLKEEVNDQVFEIVKLNRVKTKTGKDAVKLFCVCVGGNNDGKAAIKELIITQNNAKRIRDFLLACGKYEIRDELDDDGKQIVDDNGKTATYKHIPNITMEQIVGSSFKADFINHSTNDGGFFGLLQNERELF